MTSDIDIGFRTKPKDLEAFLKIQGYVPEEGGEHDRNVQVYTHIENETPTLFYSQQVGEEDRAIWRERGYKIISLLNINFQHQI